MLEEKTELASEDPIGPVQNGSLVLQGAIMTASVGIYRLKPEYLASHIGWLSITLRTEARTWEGACCFDHIDIMTAVERDRSYPLRCVPLILSKDSLSLDKVSISMHGIIVEKQQHSNIYHRIGYFHVMPNTDDPDQYSGLLQRLKDGSVDSIGKLQELGIIQKNGFGFILFIIE